MSLLKLLDIHFHIKNWFFSYKKIFYLVVKERLAGNYCVNSSAYPQIVISYFDSEDFFSNKSYAVFKSKKYSSFFKCLLFLPFDLSTLWVWTFVVLTVSFLLALHQLPLVFLGMLHFRAVSYTLSLTSVTWFSAAVSISVCLSLLEA